MVAIYCYICHRNNDVNVNVNQQDMYLNSTPAP